MSVIRLFDDIFTTDSQEYHILANAAKTIKGTPGAIVEIGTRMGGSAKLIIDSLEENEDVNRTMICIDPFGNIDLECTNKNLSIHYPNVHEVQGDPMSTEISKPVKFDYTNNMRNTIIPSLYYYAYQRGINFSFFCMEDTEFMNRFSDGVPVYDEFKKIEDKYSLVFIDGPHTNDAVQRELKFFEHRMNCGGIMVFDDVWMMDHDRIVEGYLFPTWELLERGQIKASYRKIS